MLKSVNQGGKNNCVTLQSKLENWVRRRPHTKYGYNCSDAGCKIV